MAVFRTRSERRNENRFPSGFKEKEMLKKSFSCVLHGPWDLLRPPVRVDIALFPSNRLLKCEESQNPEGPCRAMLTGRFTLERPTIASQPRGLPFFNGISFLPIYFAPTAEPETVKKGAAP